MRPSRISARFVLMEPARPSGRRALAALIVLIALGCLSSKLRAAAPDGAACEIDYWVSPQGTDTAAGDAQHPFASLERARDAVRSINHRVLCAVIVNISGEYRLDRPFVLDARDSGRENADVVYRAAPGAKPVISGAIRVDNWSLQDSKLNIWRAYVGPRSTRQLYVNGERAMRARTEPSLATFAPSGIG